MCFDRVTGKPVWPIAEKQVEKGDVPGRMVFADPAHSRPSPPPMRATASRTDDLIDFTPALHAQALELVKKYKMGPMFTPPVRQQARRSHRAP